MRTAPSLPGRVRSLVTALLLPALCLTLTQLPPARAADPAPVPRAAGAPLVQDEKSMTPAELDKALMKEVGDNSELMKNLQHLSDVIGPRLTGSKNLRRANEWAAERMKEYGLENVHQEGWEIPVGWERGTASMRVVEPETGVRIPVASWAWTPGIEGGKVTGPVVILRARTKEDLAAYKGKLKNAVVLTSAPQNIAPISDLSYGPLGAPAKKDFKKDDRKEEAKEADKKKDEVKKEPQSPCDEPADDPKKDDPKKEQPPKKEEPKKEQPKRDQPPGVGFGLQGELNAFLKAEGAACLVRDSGKPHGLLNMSGSWQGRDRAALQDAMPSLVVSHEGYTMLYRLASRPEPAVTKVEVEITNKFIPGPVECFNTIGEVRGSEKPDEVVVVGAHLDSWDLGTGTTDNGTGSCVVLETARAVAALAKRGFPPKRTIRFCLFTGEEQGLVGSRQYVTRHKEEMAKHSAALVHDTGTGRVTGLALHGWDTAKKILDPELTTLTTVEGWRGLDLGGIGGSDHQSFHTQNVPGFCCRQDVDEYRLTHHTQTDTFDHAKAPNLIEGAQVMCVMCTRVANLPELLPRNKTAPKDDGKKGETRDEPKKGDKKE